MPKAIITLPSGETAETDGSTGGWAVVGSPVTADFIRTIALDRAEKMRTAIAEVQAELANPSLRFGDPSDSVDPDIPNFTPAYLGDSNVMVVVDADLDVVEISTGPNGDLALPKTGQDTIPALVDAGNRELARLRAELDEAIGIAEQADSDERLHWRVMRWVRDEKSAHKVLTWYQRSPLGDRFSVMKGEPAP